MGTLTAMRVLAGATEVCTLIVGQTHSATGSRGSRFSYEAIRWIRCKMVLSAKIRGVWLSC